MTILIISAVLTFAVGVLILGPFSITGGRLHVRAHNADESRRRALLRQLRDLDDDLEAGKLTRADFDRLRGPVEREAASLLHARAADQQAADPKAADSKAADSKAADPKSPPTKADRPAAAGSGTAAAGSGTEAAAAAAVAERRDGRTSGRWRRRTVLLVALAGSAAAVTVLLVGAVSGRTPGQTITGNSAPGVNVLGGQPGGTAPAPSGSTAAGGAAAGGTQSGKNGPTAAQLAAVAAAENQVKQNPKSVDAHLNLANAMASAGAGQQAAVEYLAVLRLDPANPEANTNMALLAFEIGQTAEGKAMVDRVLQADPKYAEALYVRGLIDLMGLRKPKAAEHDLNAYLTVAPFGSHRTAAVTLLALARSQAAK
ncbi:MAG TPA: tetratricopeptide repeat protein [Streptosporangiaceae bacterium]|jgi:tetratricopeptide (TPR) repeat protein